MYKVIKEFKDSDGKIYKVGESYSNKDDARLEVLSTNKNKYGYPFIEEVEVKKPRIKGVKVELEG